MFCGSSAGLLLMLEPRLNGEWEVRPLSTVGGGGLVLSEESMGVVIPPTHPGWLS